MGAQEGSQKEPLNELINVLRKDSAQCRGILLSKVKIELKQVVYPYCKEEDQSTLQTVVSTCKRKRIPLESAGLRELPFLPNDCLSLREVYVRRQRKKPGSNFSQEWSFLRVV